MKKEIFPIFILALIACPLWATGDDTDLAMKLSNPVAALISVPIQANYDENLGPNEEGSVLKINIQPVIPFSLNEEWNLISRTIIPVIDQEDVPTKGQDDSGLGDTTLSLWASPKAPTSKGWIWGVGPVLLLPTATEDALGGEKWGIGPTGLALKQTGSWTVGALANHVESVAGEDRANISSTFVQPFINYVTQTKTTIVLNSESTYDWKAEAWSIPINFELRQMLHVGSQILQVGGGVRYWADSPANGPEDWGFRIQLTFLFPK